ncbi:MAG: transporter associated domain-containing protein, partial [Actinomycetota bacterium]|nr:transporter associated domain-containing protein [Actinomycetota bacterium]
YRVSSRMHVEDVAELLGIKIDADEEGVDTVLGLLAKRLGRVPIPGAAIIEDGYVLTAESSGGRRNRINAIRVERIFAEDEVKSDG